MLRKATRNQERRTRSSLHDGRHNKADRRVGRRHLVRVAMQETGSADPGVIALRLEELVEKEMNGWNASYKITFCRVCARLEQLGLGYLSDIREVIEMIQTEDWWNATAAMGV